MKKSRKIHDATDRSHRRVRFPPTRTAAASFASKPWQTVARALERLGEGEAAVLVLPQPLRIDNQH